LADGSFAILRVFQEAAPAASVFAKPHGEARAAADGKTPETSPLEVKF
jgi:hypothetical protein